MSNGQRSVFIRIAVRIRADSGKPPRPICWLVFVVLVGWSVGRQPCCLRVGVPLPGASLASESIPFPSFTVFEPNLERNLLRYTSCPSASIESKSMEAPVAAMDLDGPIPEVSDLLEGNDPADDILSILDSDSSGDEDEEINLESIDKSHTIKFPIRSNYSLSWGPIEAFRELVQNWYGRPSHQ